MNTPATTKQNKRLYSCSICVIAILLILSFGYLNYYSFTHLDFAYALPLLMISLGIFSIFVGWMRRTTYLKYRNNALIVKGAFNKTLLTPMRTVDIEPILKLSKITLVRVNFALDGIQHSYFSFTNYSAFQMLKKRQAISRVL